MGLEITNANSFLLFLKHCLLFLPCSASGASVVAIDNKIEQAMVSILVLSLQI